MPSPTSLFLQSTSFWEERERELATRDQGSLGISLFLSKMLVLHGKTKCNPSFFFSWLLQNQPHATTASSFSRYETYFTYSYRINPVVISSHFYLYLHIP